MGMAFDRETGEPVEMWNLFRCTKKRIGSNDIKVFQNIRSCFGTRDACRASIGIYFL